MFRILIELAKGARQGNLKDFVVGTKGMGGGGIFRCVLIQVALFNFAAGTFLTRALKFFCNVPLPDCARRLFWVAPKLCSCNCRWSIFYLFRVPRNRLYEGIIELNYDIHVY